MFPCARPWFLDLKMAAVCVTPVDYVVLPNARPWLLELKMNMAADYVSPGLCTMFPLGKKVSYNETNYQTE